MKIVIAGGTGQIGHILARFWAGQSVVPSQDLAHDIAHDIVILTRRSPSVQGLRASINVRYVQWNPTKFHSTGAWVAELDGADVVINLAGRTVNCRYNVRNLRAMMDSRVDSTRVLGEAMAHCKTPPKLWLQSSTATIYQHTYDTPQDETTGIIGDREAIDHPNDPRYQVPDYWRYSIDIATAWERTCMEANTPATRRVLLRTAMVMSPDPGGVFAVLRRLVKLGLGGKNGQGDQYISWIHEYDFCHALQYLIEHDDIEGPVNICSPNPLSNIDFMAQLRDACNMPLGLPAAKWQLEIGAVVLRTDTELLLKSRRVVPGRLLAHGFTFQYPEWSDAAKALVKQDELAAVSHAV